MFTEKQYYDNAVLMIDNFKRLVSEVINSMQDELLICNRLNYHSVSISNGEVILATGKRRNPYSVRKFYEAFESILESFNREVVEELVMCLQNDALRYPSILNSINNGKGSEVLLEKMYYRYNMLYRNTKYKALKVVTTCLVPRTEFYHIPFKFCMEENYLHEFFNFNYWQYLDILTFICNGGSIRDVYENRKCIVRRNEADRVQARRKEQLNESVSKTNSHFSPGRVKTPTIKKEQNMP